MKRRINKRIRGLQPVQQHKPAQAEILVTGLPGRGLKRALELLDQLGTKVCVRSLPPRLDELTAALSSENTSTLYAFYEAPWDSVVYASESEQDHLASWLEFHSGLIRLRQSFSAKLVLVNADRCFDSSDLLVPMIAGAEWLGSEREGRAERGSPPANWNSLLSRGFAVSAAEYWDVYEALESCAWLGNGSPVYRNALTSESDALSHAIGIWRLAVSLSARVETAEADMERLTKSREDLERALGEKQRTACMLEKAVLELEERAELELAAATAQLEHAEQRVRALDDSIATMRQVAGAREHELLEVLRQSEEVMRANFAKLQNEHKAALAAAQEREQGLLAEHHLALASAIEQNNRLLQEARETAIAPFLEREENLEADLFTLRRENEQLQASLKQTQETFAVSEARIRALEVGLEKAQQQREAAVQMNGDLTATLKVLEVQVEETVRRNETLSQQRQQLEEELDVVRESTKQEETRREEDLNRLAANEIELTRIAAALKQRVQEAEGELNDAAELARQQTAEAKQAWEKLRSERANAQALKEALASAQAINVDLDSVNSTAKQALVKAEARVKTLESELTRVLGQAEQVELKHREAIVALEKRNKETQAEADLLLLQLKQVQEELEHYFNKSRDATVALEQSAETFKRARQVVMRLVRAKAA